MSNITGGYATIEEIEEMTLSKGKLSAVYAKNASNAQKDGDYAFSDNIIHPQTGEVLKAVKGYCTNGSAFERPCYYAEYEGKSGTYYYLDQTKYKGFASNPMTIYEQIEEDRQEYLEKFAERDLMDEDDNKEENLNNQQQGEEDNTNDEENGEDMDF
ncbi:MAG: hypothetical protein J6B45_00010 [Clostridia bacterium]|nr:hypothetical protein [Clostridia bacterium]